MISRSVAPEFDVIDRGMAALLDWRRSVLEWLA
jgi:hypothetical protein